MIHKIVKKRNSKDDMIFFVEEIKEENHKILYRFKGDTKFYKAVDYENVYIKPFYMVHKLIGIPVVGSSVECYTNEYGRVYDSRIDNIISVTDRSYAGKCIKEIETEDSMYILVE